MGTAREIELGKLRLGAGNALFLIAGPCVIESELHACVMAEKVAKIAADAGLPYIFKASYDKANRSSLKAFRGPGMKEGLRILEKIKKEFKVPVLTDIHEASQAEAVAEIGRASCRERGEISGVAGSLKKKKKRRCRWQK